MAAYIPFAEIKAKVKIEDVAAMLGLQLKTEPGGSRAPCPVCKSKNPRAIMIVPKTQSFHCWSAKGQKTGSDAIALVAHCRGSDAQAAAREIATHFGIPIGGATAPQRPEAAAQAATATKPGIASVAGKLEPEHELVQTLVTVEEAKALGIGFRQSGGSLAGRVMIPVRLETGEPVCYVGWHPEKTPPLKFGKITLP